MIRPLLLILAAGPLAAQPPDWAAQARPVLAELYSLNHDRAEQLSLDLIHQHPGEPLGYALLARTLWARILNNEQALNAERFFSVPAPWRSSPLARKVPPDLRTRFLDSSRKAIDLARARLHSSPDHRPSLLILGFTYVNLAGFEWAVEGRLWQAFRSGEHAVDAHRRLLSLEPSWGDPRLANGVALYLANTLPWRVRWLAILFGFAGGRERGKREIEIAARTGFLLDDDARTMLVLLYQRDAQFDLARPILAGLHARYPRNFIVEMEQASLEMRAARPADALAIYRRILAKAAAARDGYERILRPGLYYNTGLAARASGSLEEAAAFFRASLSHPTATAGLSQLELGKTLDLLGRRDEAKAAYAQAAASPDVSGSRDQAQRYLRAPFNRAR